MTDMDTVLEAVEGGLGHPEFRARLFAMLARAGLYHAPRSHLIHYRTQATGQMLATGLYRCQVRQIIQDRFGVSRRSAYRLIERALNARQMNLFDDA